MIAWQKPNIKPWLRTVAFLTAFVFTFTSVVWDGGLTKAHAAATQSPLTESSLSSSSASSLLAQVALPDTYGTVKSSFLGDPEKVVIHIQDAHVNEEAQRNIANIIRYFSEKYQLGLVNLEGASGELYTKLFSFFPSKQARQSVADYFLGEGRLTGPEYFAIVDASPVILNGV